MSAPVPGWYPHPHNDDMLRWWDGDGWTDHVQPKPVPVAPPPTGPAYQAAPPPMAAAPMTSGSEVRYDPMESYGGGTALGTMAPAGEADVLRDATAPWNTPDLEPFSPAPDPAFQPENGNGNGYRVIEAQRAPFDPPPWPETPEPTTDVTDDGDSGRLRKILIAAVVVVAVAIAGMLAYKQGLLDKVIGKSDEAASSAKTYEGAGYSFEAPRSWTAVSAEAYGSDFAFASPNSSVVVLDTTQVSPMTNLSDPAIQNFVFNNAVKGLQLQLDGLAIASSAPYTDNGVVAGKQVVLTGMNADGQATKVTYTVFVKERLVVVIGMLEHGETNPANQTEYSALLKTFQYPTSS